jgi:hypothetical protein
VSFRKPFRAAPPRLGPYYRAEQRRGDAAFARKVLGAALVGGALVGALSVPAVRQQVAAAPVEMGITRARAPQPGDRWAGCNDARAAGTAPIYAGEPGYREGMDGDGDGVACEPYPGM